MASTKKKSGAGVSAAPGRELKKAAAKASGAAKKKASAKKRPTATKAGTKATAKKAPRKPAAPKTAKKTAAPKKTVKKAAAKKARSKKPAARKMVGAAKPAATKAKGKAAPKAAKKRTATKKAAAPKKPTKKTSSRSAVKKAPKKPAARKTAAKASARKKASAKKATTRKAAVKKTTVRTKATASTGRPRVPRRRWRETPVVPPGAIPGLSEEDQIRSAKYLPRELPKRLFEEERFLFPESYGVNRVRLLVRDPEWVFAYWDVSAETIKGLARSLGERAFKLSRLTLRVLDPVSGGASDILLPPGARWWYIRTDVARRTYRAEIGITLPSGEFRRLAESNAVVTPRVGPSRERARRRLSYAGAGDLPPEEAAAAGRADREAGLATEPWTGNGEAAGASERGGASESFRPTRPGEARPGASDTFRPGASDVHRR
jgi:hypothetical protein